MGNDGLAKVIGVGDVCLETNMGMKLLLKDVRHAPDVRLNLVSVKRLDNEGFVNTFGFGQWKLTKGNLVVAREKGTSSLYVMHAMIAKGSVNAIESKEVCSLWH